MLWDTRAKQLPVAKTPLAAGGHTYPVYSMKVVGTQNAHHIMTSGTDGTVCSWLPEVMAQPQVGVVSSKEDEFGANNGGSCRNPSN